MEAAELPWPVVSFALPRAILTVMSVFMVSPEAYGTVSKSYKR